MLAKFDAVNIICNCIKKIEKKYIILNLVVMIVLIIGVIIIFNNYEWYDTTIVKIKRVESSLSNVQSGTEEKYYDQEISGIIMNGDFKGQSASLKNEYSLSGVLDDKYKPGDEVFIKINANDNGISGSILNLKRDKYMAIVLALFIFLLFVVTNKKGFFIFISLFVNICVLWYALALNHKGYNILIISICLVLFFTFFSLIFISGLKKKTFVAILSTLISLFITMIIFKIFMIYTQGVDYTYMEYNTGQNSLSGLFLSQILIGGMGAIMDVAITEASAINELVNINKEISIKTLIKSGYEVGYDIMGTMINILLFTYICGIIPLIILKMKNNIKISTIVTQIPMEIYGFMIGSIGVLLAIPISLFTSIVIFKKLRRLI